MRGATQLSTFLAAAVVAFAALAGTASASTTLGDTATGLAVTGDATADWVEVWSEHSFIVASEDRAVPATCVHYSATWGGCDVSGTTGETLDVDLGEGDNILEFMSQPANLGTVTVTSGAGDDYIDLYGEGGSPAPLATVNTGAGDDVVDARNGAADTIDCGAGADDTVYTDGAHPSLTGCEHVIGEAEADARATRVTWAESSGFANYTNHHFIHAVPVGGSVASLRCRTSVTGWQPCGGGLDVGPLGGFPDDPHIDAPTWYPAAALGRGEDGALGLIDPESEGFFAFDYTAPSHPYLAGALPTVANGLAIGSWPIGGGAGFDRLCSFDGHPVRSCDATDGAWGPVAAGDHVLVAWLRDAAGNLSVPLTLRWHVSPAGVATQDPPAQPPVVTPQPGLPKLTAPRQPVRAKRGVLSLPVSCTVAAGCRARAYVLKFTAGGRTVKVRASVKALAAGRNARLAFKLSSRQIKALGHRTVKATVTAAGAKPVRIKLRA